MKRTFVPHEIEWSSREVQRFWDWLSMSESYQIKNFANLAGDQIIRYMIKHRVPLQGRILDYGCGTGSMLEKLLEKGLTCEGIEASPVAARIASSKTLKFERSRGVATIHSQSMDFADATFDVIIALEVLEHIPRPNLEPVLEEWNRVCKRGGFIVISTPNAEDIDSGKILCPECGCIFHKGQHVSAWDRNSLVSLMEQLGFSTIDCRALTLRSKSVLNPLRELAAIFLKQKRLNLLYVGRKD